MHTPPMLMAIGSSYPWWFIVVFVCGTGGLGVAAWKVIRGASALVSILRVLTGEKGGKGKREVKPLVDVVDGLVSTVEGVVAVQELQGNELALMRTDVSAVRSDITCNGGNTNKIGDRVVRTEHRQTELELSVKRLEAAAGTTPQS